MNANLRLIFIAFSLLYSSLIFGQAHAFDKAVVLAYFPSWQETFAAESQNSALRETPSYINYVFLAFAKPDLRYTKDSYDISLTGIEVPYDGCTLKESVAALKNKGIHVILSVGGETYWNSSTIYNDIRFQEIKDLVDDIGFVGIDWDFEPNGSFANIGTPENVQHYITMIDSGRHYMPKNEGYIIACAPSGIGALGGLNNDDPSSPFKYSERNNLTGENDDNLYNFPAQTNGINLFGFSATGHMIPVLQAVGNKIDLVAFQGYNIGGSLNRTIMYDAYAHYAEIYNFKIAAGVHVPNEPYGPHYTYTHQTVANLADHIYTDASRQNEKDGIMLWQMLLRAPEGTGHSYLKVASDVLNGETVSTALANAENFSLQPYSGGAEGCDGGSAGEKYCNAPAYVSTAAYPAPNTLVYSDCAIWKNKWYANPGEEPGDNMVWEFVDDCNEGPSCGNPADRYVEIDTTACNSFTSPSGKYTWIFDGVYKDTIATSMDGDSIMTINLTIESISNIITQTGNTLSAKQNDATYQWLNCESGMSAISGENKQSFTPTINGNYAVEIVKGSCKDTSSCQQVILSSIKSNNTNAWSISPNPAQNTIKLSAAVGSEYQIRSITGKLLNHGRIESYNTLINIAQYTSGLYFITVNSNKGNTKTFKLIKE